MVRIRPCNGPVSLSGGDRVIEVIKVLKLEAREIQMVRFLSRIIVLLVMAILTGSVYASVVINGTRVIYPGKEREVVVQIENKNPRPALVQSWMDSGNEDELPQNSTAPFLLSPPLVRIDEGQGQALRLIYNQKSLPQDRESVFWLNVLDIPPDPKGKILSEQYLQLAVRTRIKVFFRPQGLPGTATEAPAKLNWRIVPDGKGQYGLECDNPTAFHVSFGGITLKGADGANKSENKQGILMVAPKSKLLIAMKNLNGPLAANSKVKFDYISDYGAYIEQTSALSN
ncbi:molecular chaperone EcpD [Serratia sp. S1B]|nr:molecular chaperone EcpD [Serratia sp. S1B]